MGFGLLITPEKFTGLNYWRAHMKYLNALQEAWKELNAWVSDGRLIPENEESIQCFLYRGMVNQLGTAVGVRSKPTTDKPRSIFDDTGKLDVKNMHFPDFILGEPKEVVVEIKFSRAKGSIFGACKRDIEKMRKHHDGVKVRRVFLLFDVNPTHVALTEAQVSLLKKLDPDVILLHYPTTFHPDTAGKRASATKAATSSDQI